MDDAKTDAPVVTQSNPMPTTESDADKLVEAVEAAGFVHPHAPEGYPTPGHKMAAEQANEPVDHLAEISILAEQARTATPSGMQSIADQIQGHVEAMK